MKDTEGDLFEEAYFFVRNSPERKCNDRDMVREAERIITESSVDAGKKNKKRENKTRFKIALWKK